MRHKAQVSTFGRATNARRALIRGLVFALVRDGRIRTTVAKAKELKRHAERAVTIAKTSGKAKDPSKALHARRILLARYPNKETVEALMTTIAPQYLDRDGGYTRIIKVGRRPGDSAEMALIEWLHYEAPFTTGNEGSSKSKTASVKKKAVKAGSSEKKPKKTTKKKSVE